MSLWDKTMIIPEILFEDNQILVALKPPGILSQEASLDAEDMLTILKQYLKKKYNKPGNVFLGLVHRLDHNTGGIMVFAKTSKAASRLSNSIRLGEFEKTYLAVIEGEIKTGSSGEFLDYLKKDNQQLKAFTSVKEQGKQAKLSYRSIAQSTLADIKTTLIEVSLETGRFHQIRAQFASRRYPLLNDIKYGAKPVANNDLIALWAYKLAFKHPVSGEWLTFRKEPQNILFDAYSDIISQLN
jgi:23S rRNA pseudouridine1911/1915/1917 synthase